VFQSYDVNTTGASCGLGNSANIPAVAINTVAPVTTTTTLTPTTTTLTPTTTTTPAIPPSTTTSATTSSTTTTSGPSKPFPPANVSYPNGAIIAFGSTNYVFAGGRAFSATASQLAAVHKVNPAKVLTAPSGATAPTTATVRSGTLVFTKPVDGNPTIYVAGTDGKLHGFSTGKQFLNNGYNGALVVTLPSLGGVKIGPTVGVAGPAVTAMATRADGAIINSSGTFFTFAGGRAFGIPTQSALLRIKAGNPAKELRGSIGSAQTGAAIATGVLLSLSPAVYVSYQGDVYPFKTPTQLANAGYGGTAAILVPHAGGLTVVFPYSGS
jgi:hypothetical protein